MCALDPVRRAELCASLGKTAMADPDFLVPSDHLGLSVQGPSSSLGFELHLVPPSVLTVGRTTTNSYSKDNQTNRCDEEIVLKTSNENMMSQEQTKFEDFIAIKEFQDMFPDELSIFPPDREMKLAINLALETKPVTQALHKMAPVKMRKLAKQMQETFKKEAIRPSVSHESTEDHAKHLMTTGESEKKEVVCKVYKVKVLMVESISNQYADLECAQSTPGSNLATPSVLQLAKTRKLSAELQSEKFIEDLKKVFLNLIEECRDISAKSKAHSTLGHIEGVNDVSYDVATGANDSSNVESNLSRKHTKRNMFIVNKTRNLLMLYIFKVASAYSGLYGSSGSIEPPYSIDIKEGIVLTMYWHVWTSRGI
ncbi:hypothetical protein AgCh_024961 [Apium graveolens]